MKVFIGWSGERSQALGQALREWLPLVLHYVEPWLSETDIAAGERWAHTIAKELEASNFGIVSITRQNASSPWMHFEAGALAKSLEEGRVVPLLLDLEFKEISGPLAQFQAKKVDEEGLREVVHSINHAASEQVPEPQAVKLFEALWPKLQAEISVIPDDSGGGGPARPQSEILEELVASVRSVEATVSEPSFKRRRYGRLGGVDPFMIHEMARRSAKGPDDPILLLATASVFRDDIPWLYELGLEAYRAATASDSRRADACLGRFLQAVEGTIRGPFVEELGVHPREIMMITEELLHRYRPRRQPAKARRRKEPQAEA